MTDQDEEEEVWNIVSAMIIDPAAGVERNCVITMDSDGISVYHRSSGTNHRRRTHRSGGHKHHPNRST